MTFPKRDSELITIEEIQERINSIQRQFDIENNKSTGRNGIVRCGDMEKKLTKLRKFTARADILRKRMKDLNK